MSRQGVAPRPSVSASIGIKNDAVPLSLVKFNFFPFFIVFGVKLYLARVRPRLSVSQCFFSVSSVYSVVNLNSLSMSIRVGVNLVKAGNRHNNRSN